MQYQQTDRHHHLFPGTTLPFICLHPTRLMVFYFAWLCFLHLLHYLLYFGHVHNFHADRQPAPQLLLTPPPPLPTAPPPPSKVKRQETQQRDGQINHL